MTAIASPHNPRLQELRKLQRRRERERSASFVAEGEDLIEAAALAGREPLAGYRLAGSGIGGDGFHDVEDKALASVCTLASGARALAIYQQHYADAPSGPLCLYLHGLSDPGNVGAVLRSAEAFGASSVALGPRCADPHSPKAVRASMGAIFSMPIAKVQAPTIATASPQEVAESPQASASTPQAIEAVLSQLPGRTVALAAHEGMPLHELDLRTRPLTLLLGAEREGLPQDLLGACDEVAHIPIATESLNAAMAATVALYELTRETSSRVRP